MLSVLIFQPYQRDFEEDHIFVWMMRDRNNSYPNWGSRFWGKKVSEGAFYQPKGLEALKD